MFLKFYWMIFVLTLMLGTMIACSSSSWMISWIGLEVNLMSFIPLLLIKLTSSHSEAAIKYFLTQALASVILIFSGVLFNEITLVNNFTMSNELITLSLGIKAGLAPTHFWFPQVTELTEWTQAMILLTWQKIAPIILISFSTTLWIFFMIMTSAFIGMGGGFNQNSMKKILVYSSITHLAWLTTLIFCNEKSWWVYLGVYFFLVMSLILPLAYANIKSMTKLNLMPSKSSTKLFIFINILSMAGLPPFVGILPKILAITNFMILNSSFILLVSILILTSLITLFYYLRMFFSSFMIFTLNNSMHPSKINFNPLINFIFTLSIAGNILTMPLVLLS